MEKLDHSCISGGNVQWHSHYGNQFGSFFKNGTHKLPYNPEIYLRSEHYIHAKTCEYSNLFITTRNWKQPRCPPMGEYLNKLWYIHTMKYYSTTERNELWIHAVICMILQRIMLTENTPILKGYIEKITEMKNRLVVTNC